MNPLPRIRLVVICIALISAIAVTSAGAAQRPARSANMASSKTVKPRKSHRQVRRAHLDPRLENAVAVSSPRTARASLAHNPPGLLFDGAKIDDFREIQAAPGAVTEVPDPAGSGETVLKMTVKNSDVYPLTPTDNPRAQALGPSTIEAGDEFWLSTKFMLPENFPSVPGWLALISVYGPPFNGSAPWNFAISGNEFRFQRNENYDSDIPWRAPLIEGKWVTVMTHERFAENGFIEMWVDGEQVNFFPPGNRNPEHHAETKRLEMATMDDSNDGGANAPKIMQYREAGMFEVASVYFGALKMGTTRASVEG